MRKLLMTLCMVSFSSHLLGISQNSETEEYYDAVEQLDLHTPGNDDEEFFDSVEYLTSINGLPHEMVGHIAGFLDPSSLVGFTKVSRKMNQIGVPIQDKTNLSYLSDDEVIELAYKSNSKKIIQPATKNLLEKLPELETKSEKVIAIFVWAEVWDQVRGQVWAQVGAQVEDQVRDQVWDQVRTQVGAQVEVQVRVQLGDPVGAQVWDQDWDQDWSQLGDPVGDQVWAQVRTQVGDPVGAQVGAQVRGQLGAQINGILHLYPNLGTSEEDRNKFINALIPVINKTISTFHYFFVKRLLEPSEDVTKIHRDGSRMTILESIVDQFKDEVDEDHINLDAVYNAATPADWEELNPNIKNFLLPIQKYSRPDAN